MPIRRRWGLLRAHFRFRDNYFGRADCDMLRRDRPPRCFDDDDDAILITMGLHDIDDDVRAISARHQHDTAPH